MRTNWKRLIVEANAYVPGAALRALSACLSLVAKGKALPPPLRDYFLAGIERARSVDGMDFAAAFKLDQLEDTDLGQDLTLALAVEDARRNGASLTNPSNTRKTNTAFHIVGAAHHKSPETVRKAWKACRTKYQLGLETGAKTKVKKRG